MTTATDEHAPTRPVRRWVPWAGLVARLVLGVVFLYAGALKLFDPDASAKAVQAYRLLDPELARLVGYALPTFEVALALLLIAGLFTRVAAILSGLLLVAFMIGVISVWVRGYNIDCGCFGGGGDVTGDDRDVRYATEIARDLGLLILAGFLAYRPRTAFSLDGWMSPHLHHRHSGPSPADLAEDDPDREDG